MKIPLAYCIHKWAAQRFPSIPYPSAIPPRRIFLTHRLAWQERISRTLMGSIVIGASLAALLFARSF